MGNYGLACFLEREAVPWRGFAGPFPRLQRAARWMCAGPPRHAVRVCGAQAPNSC